MESAHFVGLDMQIRPERFTKFPQTLVNNEAVKIPEWKIDQPNQHSLKCLISKCDPVQMIYWISIEIFKMKCPT